MSTSQFWKKVGWVLATVGILALDLIPSELTVFIYGLTKQGMLAQVIGLITMAGLVTLIVWLAYRHQVLAKDNISFKRFVLTLVLGFVAITLCSLVGQVVMRLTASTQMINQDAIRSSLRALPVFTLVYTALVAPVIEEIIFRGFIFKKWFPHHDYWALAVSTILFALLHRAFTPGSFITYGGMSLIFGLVYLKNGKNLKYSIGLHLFNNFWALLAMLLLLLH
ncbi:CPBP family intramembrane glutamic endopeptidase [Streptococcus sp. DD12]|uniref:CPBP family intramembrane glutamic endopeptidase n=1 Tax=Streptococcus sp. DD12 TaxID=1777880 RepID=UPI00079576A1|nr:type II CAAX endopeptidase family protein [Streptococcus sp. DD12]KXT75846.1 Membrane-bound protease, CAAX family [Streptococcus sp. DD12]